MDKKWNSWQEAYTLQISRAFLAFSEHFIYWLSFCPVHSCLWCRTHTVFVSTVHVWHSRCPHPATDRQMLMGQLKGMTALLWLPYPNANFPQASGLTHKIWASCCHLPIRDGQKRRTKTLGLLSNFHVIHLKIISKIRLNVSWVIVFWIQCSNSWELINYMQ